MEESRLTFIGNVVEAFHRVSRLFEQVLQAAPQLNNSLCFLARVAPGVHGADEPVSMSSSKSKVLLENNIVSSHEKRRRESS